MYQVNDLIVYGNNGVCKVVDIGIPNITGIDDSKQYYTLTPVYSKGSLIYTPVDNSRVTMRKIISNKQAKELIDRIPFIPTIKAMNDKLLDELYKTAISSQDCEELIKVIKTVYMKQQNKISEGKKPSQLDERHLKQAEDLLFSELSIALNIPKEDMKSYIEQRVIQLEQV